MAPEVILSGDVDHQEYDARADVWFVTQSVLTIVMKMMVIHDAPEFFFRIPGLFFMVPTGFSCSFYGSRSIFHDSRFCCLGQWASAS